MLPAQITPRVRPLFKHQNNSLCKGFYVTDNTKAMFWGAVGSRPRGVPEKFPSLGRCRRLLRGAVVALAAACNAPGGRQAAWGAAVPKGSRHNPDIYDICQLWGRCSCCSCSACSVAPGAGCPSRGGQQEEEDAPGTPSIRREILQDVWGCDGKGGECVARCRETAPESLLAQPQSPSPPGHFVAGGLCAGGPQIWSPCG